jgi:hypothetical protein
VAALFFVFRTCSSRSAIMEGLTKFLMGGGRGGSSRR